MSKNKNWFPIIDYEKCTGCLSCVQFCPHGVFEIEKAIPIVANPDNCVEFCRGCQKGACEFNAITFYEDKIEGEISNGGCSCGSNEIVDNQ